MNFINFKFNNNDSNSNHIKFIIIGNDIYNLSFTNFPHNPFFT